MTWFSVWMSVAMKSMVLLAAAWMVTLALRRKSAAARHLVWTVAFAGLLVLPLLSVALPELRMPVPRVVMEPASVVFQATGSARVEGRAVPMGAGAAGDHAATWHPDWTMWLMLVWAAGASFALARMTAAYVAMWRVRRSSRMLGNEGMVSILSGPRGSMPMTFGLRRPVILMPEDSSEWSEERRRVVIEHELAHVRRHDAATHLLARGALAAHWWNPLAWAAWREFVKERERAADDLVLGAGAQAPEYAAHLLAVARDMRTPRALAWAGAAMARQSQLEGRLLAILDSGVDRTAPGRASVLTSALLAVAMIVPLAAVRAQDDAASAIPGDVDAAIRTAKSQKNYQTLEAAAQTAATAAKYDIALKLERAAVAIRSEVAGEQSEEYGVGLVKLGELEEAQDPKAGGDSYAKAAQILGNRAEGAVAFIHLGLSALDKRDYAQAFESFQRAQAADPEHAGRALMWMAVTREKEKNAGEADELYQRAIGAQEETSNDAALVMRVYSHFLKSQGREDDSAAQQKRADAIEKANAQAAPPVPDGVSRIGKGVTAPVPLKRPEPNYTAEARLAGLQGTVVMQVVVGIDGRAGHMHIIRSLWLGLDKKALEAIRQWEFKPASKDGEPVPVMATIEVNFRLM